MGFNKKFFTTGGIVASAPPAAAAFDPLQNFETVTYTGNGSTQKITGYIRKGAAFNGSSSLIDTGISGHTLAWGYSGWFNTTSTSGTILASLNGSGSSDGLTISMQSGGAVRFLFAVGGTNIVSSGFDVGSGFNDGNWHFFAYTWDGVSGNDVAIRIDNNSYSYTPTLNGTTSSDATLKIGRFGIVAGGGYLEGKVDQVRIFNKKLSSSELTTLYRETYADPTKSTTDIFGDGSGVALYELDEDANSSNFGQAAVFNGSSSKIILPNSLGTAVGNNNFSVSFWVYVNDASNDEVYVNLSNPYQFYVRKFASGNIYIELGGVNGFDTGVSLGTGWHHIAVTKSSSAGLVLYVDNSANTSSSKTANLGSSSVDVSLGGYNNGTLPLDGKLDQVRIYSSVLSSTDVEKLYEESADVPTTNLVAHYKLNGNAEDVLDTYDGTASNVTYSAGVYGGTPTNVNFLGMAFQPDLVWIKNRDASYSHMLYDSIRGAGQDLSSDTTSGEGTVTGLMSSFDTNGFTVVAGGSNRTNFSGEDYVAWCWKAADTTVTDSSTGDITADIRANTDAGFSIVDFNTGTTNNVTVPHGLNETPELIILKSWSNNSAWTVYAEPLGATKRLLLHKSDAASINSNAFNDTAPDSDVFTIGNVATYYVQNYDYIAYCFHSVDGYQKVGSYSGNASTKLVYTDSNDDGTGTGGFKPRFVMIRSTSASRNWTIFDNKRFGTHGYNDKYIRANTSGAEVDSSDNDILEFTNTGFTLRATDLNVNGSGETYIYLAIA